MAAFFEDIGISESPEMSYALEMRYTTQAFEIPVEIDAVIAIT